MSVKRSAFTRSGGICEAHGKLYGLPDSLRCQNKLSYGVEFDHIVADGLSSDGYGGVTLDNIFAVCVRCHRHKSSVNDVPRIAKMKRQRDKHLGIKKVKRNWPTRKFGQ
jgi:5-methylcytosine-specific restriction endonuclease McrA